MDGTFASETKPRFSDPVALVKYHLGSEAAEYAVAFEDRPLERLVITFPEGVMTALYCMEKQTVDIQLPHWAKMLGWEWEQISE